jgi:tetratricopeptide (TPR) repeat protein
MRPVPNDPPATPDDSNLQDRTSAETETRPDMPTLSRLPAGSTRLREDQAAAPPGPARMGHSHPVQSGRAQPLEVGSVLGDCLITGQLGSGSSCRIFLALHQRLQVPVALKVVWPTDSGEDGLVYQHLQFEARVLARLNHPHIIRLWDFVSESAYPHLVLEHVEGPSLAELIHHSGRLAADRALQVAVQVAEGLAAAAKGGVVHRDVKPGNIVLHRDGHAKLVDFGHALLGGEAAATSGIGSAATEPIGTPAYLAPEQCGGGSTIDYRADIYALGATLYHALTGRLPFTGPTQRDVLFKQARQQPIAPYVLVPSVPQDLSDLIMMMMAKDPNDRPQTYEEVLAALQHARGLAVGRRTGAALTLSPPPAPAVEDTPRAPASGDASLGRLMEEALAAIAAGKRRRAFRLLAAATELEPREEQAWSLLAGVATRTQQVLTALQRVVALNPTNESARRRLRSARLEAGLAALRAGNKPLARRHLLRVVAEDAHNQKAWLNLAAAAEFALESALALEQVLVLNPSSEPAHRWLTKHRARQARPGSPWCCPLCQSEATEAQVRCQRCQAVLSLGDLEAVVTNDRANQELMRQAIARHEAGRRQRSRFLPYYWLGLAYLNAKRFGPALHCLRVAAKLRPELAIFRARVRALAARVTKTGGEEDASPRADQS